MNADDLDERFRDIIAELMGQELDGREAAESYLDAFKSIYLNQEGSRNDFRHRYSEITNIIFTPQPDNGKDGEPSYRRFSYGANMLSENMRNICELAEKTGNHELLKPLSKVRDHVDLEVIRLNYNTEINLYQDDRMRDLTNSILAYREVAQAQFNDAKKTVGEATKKLEESETRIMRENVTVLGIFTGIVIAFVAGMTFSSSVLQNMNDVSIYRLLLMSGLVGGFTVNIVALLFVFLSKATKRDWGDIRCITLLVNLFVAAFLCVVVFARFYIELPTH